MTEFMCPLCLRYNRVRNIDLEHNLKCYECSHVFGVINDVEDDFFITTPEFKDAPLIEGKPILL